MVTPSTVDEAPGTVPVVMTDPIGQSVVWAGFVAAFGGEIENHIGAEQLLRAAPVGGISVKDVAGFVLVEDAAAGEFLHLHVAHLEVVVNLALGKLVLRERHVVVVVEVASKRRNP